MNFDRLNKWLALFANLGVVAGIVFLAMEIRSNTESNRISIQSAFSTNWVNINGGIAQNPELAALIEKAIAGESLSVVEHRLLHHFVRQLLSQAVMMARLYEEGFATKDDVRNAYRGLQINIQYPWFREEYEEFGERSRKILLEKDGLEMWFDSVNQ